MTDLDHLYALRQQGAEWRDLTDDERRAFIDHLATLMEMMNIDVKPDRS